MMSKYKVTMEDLQQITDRSEIVPLLNKMEAKNVCEIGVQHGGYMQQLLTSNLEKIVGVDCYQDTSLIGQNDSAYSQELLDGQYLLMLGWAKLLPRIHMVRDFSVNASKQFEDEYFDYVYIDADHSEQAVWEDISAWWPKVRSGGIIAGHDYSPAIVTIKGTVFKFGVIEAVNKFSAYKHVPFHADKNMSWFMVKP